MYKKNSMRHWHVGYCQWEGKLYRMAFGQFFNREGFYDGMNGHTSAVQSIRVNEAEQEYEIQTLNTLYHCSFDSLLFELQDKSGCTLPEYERIKKAYHRPVDTTKLTKKDMLLVLSDYSDYFFEDLVYLNEDGSEVHCGGYPHIGMIVDTFLIGGHDEVYDATNRIDIRYYVGFDGIEFYSLDTGGRNLWIENKGDSPLFIQRDRIKLAPKERIPYTISADVPQD